MSVGGCHKTRSKYVTTSNIKTRKYMHVCVGKFFLMFYVVLRRKYKYLTFIKNSSRFILNGVSTPQIHSSARFSVLCTRLVKAIFLIIRLIGNFGGLQICHAWKQ